MRQSPMYAKVGTGPGRYVYTYRWRGHQFPIVGDVLYVRESMEQKPYRVRCWQVDEESYPTIYFLERW
jgi:hypothetical protein